MPWDSTAARKGGRARDFFFSSRRRHTRLQGDWSSDVCSSDLPAHADAGKMGPYAAVFVFAVGIFLSSFIWNTLAMKKPFIGTPVKFGQYFDGGFNTHLTGILGGAIWGLGMSFNLLASNRAGFAISRSE